MSYDGRDSYSRPSNPAEYGGGGSVGANYYDTSADFSDQPQHRIHQQGEGRHQSDFHQAIHQAKQQHGDDADSDHTSLFSQAIGFISEHKDRFSTEEIDEGQVVGAHQTLYGGGGGGGAGQHDADTLGAGAALQALKMFASGEESQGGGGGHDQNKLIGMAMAQAGKLWDQQNKHGNVATDKQSAVNSAAKMALKMYMKSDGGGLSGLGRPAGSGGGPGLLNLASKFLK